MKRIFVASAAAFCVLAPPIAAQTPGVVVDPNSPSGKEYAVPLNAARQTADPSRGGSSGTVSGQPAPLFGEGVGDRETGDRESAASRGKHQSKGSARSVTEPVDPEVQRALAAAASRPGAPGGSGAGLAVGMGAAAALALGAVGGLAFRRRRSRPG